MSLFVLDTDQVSSSEEAMKTLFSKLTDLAGSVRNLNIKDDDDFGFVNAKKVIASNIDACATRVNNTATYMDVVVSSHTKLQENEFIDPDEKERIEKEKKEAEEKKKKEEERKRKQEQNVSPRANPTGGAGDKGTKTGNQGKKGTSSTTGSKVNPTTTGNKDGKTASSSGITTSMPEISTSTPAIITPSLLSIGYAYIDLSVVPQATSDLFNNPSFAYQDNGYAMIGSRYVISCSTDVGKVGDVVSFVKKDGSSVECVVGYNTVSDKYKNTINFIVDPDKKTIMEEDDSKLLLSDLDHIENKGPLENNKENESKNEEKSEDSTLPKDTGTSFEEKGTKVEDIASHEEVVVTPTKSSSVIYTSNSYSNENNTPIGDSTEYVPEIDNIETEQEIEEPEEDITSSDGVVKGNTYKIPTADTTVSTTSNKGNNFIPIAAGLSAAAAAGIGAKAYMDRKNNNDNGEEDEIGEGDWSEVEEKPESNSTDKEESVHEEHNILGEEKYEARNSSDLANLQ